MQGIKNYTVVRLLFTATVTSMLITSCGQMWLRQDNDGDGHPLVAPRFLPSEWLQRSLMHKIHDAQITVCAKGTSWPYALPEIIDEELAKWLIPMRIVTKEKIRPKVKVQYAHSRFDGGCAARPDFYFEMAETCDRSHVTMKWDALSLVLCLDDSTLGTIRPVVLHELGHVLGFDDVYLEKGKTDDEPQDKATGCITPYRQTVMCHLNQDLLPADIIGAQQIYCRFWPCDS